MPFYLHLALQYYQYRQDSTACLSDDKYVYLILDNRPHHREYKRTHEPLNKENHSRKNDEAFSGRTPVKAGSGQLAQDFTPTGTDHRVISCDE